MGTTVDTVAILHAAEQIKNIAQQVRDISARAFSSMQASAETLQGEAGTAMQNNLMTIKGDVQEIGSGLVIVEKALYDYAKQVEAADQAAKEAIEGQ